MFYLASRLRITFLARRLRLMARARDRPLGQAGSDGKDKTPNGKLSLLCDWVILFDLNYSGFQGRLWPLLG